MTNVTYIRYEIIPQNCSRMIIRSICNFKTRGERRATKGDQKRRPNTTMWGEWKERAEVRRLTSFERFICVRENLIVEWEWYGVEWTELRWYRKTKIISWCIVMITPYTKRRWRRNTMKNELYDNIWFIDWCSLNIKLTNCNFSKMHIKTWTQLSYRLLLVKVAIKMTD